MSIGPSMPLRLEKPEGIDLAQAARYFGARGGADAATQALLEKCAVPLLAACLLYTSPSPRDRSVSRMPSSA